MLFQAELVSGYKSKTEVAGSSDVTEQYAGSGCGAVLQFKSGVTGDVAEIAKAALNVCPVRFMVI